MKAIKITSPLDRELMNKKLCIWCHESSDNNNFPYCSKTCEALHKKHKDN